MRRRFSRLFAKWALIFTFFSTLLILRLNWDLLFGDGHDFLIVRRFEPVQLPLYECPTPTINHSGRSATEDVKDAKERIKLAQTHNVYQRILVVTSSKSATTPSLAAKGVIDFLENFKVPLREEVIPTTSDESGREGDLRSQQWLLELAGKGRYSLLMFTDYRLYAALQEAEKATIHAYCRKHGVGLISLLPSRGDSSGEEDETIGPISVLNAQYVRNLRFPYSSPIRWVARAGTTLAQLDQDEAMHALIKGPSSKSASAEDIQTVVEVEDPYGNGRLAAGVLLRESEGVEHIVLSHDPHLGWWMKLALLDSLIYMAPAIADPQLERFLQIDIDDIFVGQSGTRMLPSDVKALRQTQQELQQHIQAFRFTLGFSGYFFRHGDADEQEGDEELVASGDNFHWFPHMWRHNHAHEHGEEQLVEAMTQNKQFAQQANLPTRLNYAISPQHSGVYPIYESLYSAWLKVWNATVTSTEEYPHLRPFSQRRGFQHRGISVLPRQTCGLFTHTSHFHAYPGGVERLQRNILGGDLFTTLLLNHYSVFMTHQQNYANDRLAAYTFLSAVRFLNCWTNLHLRSIPPVELAERYFQRFPRERRLFYTNPCVDGRHRKMLAPNSSLCSSAVFNKPNLIIVGPQKTGTSALSLFLSLHPAASTNVPINGSFEELQFFGGNNYHRGLEWYLEKFPRQGADTDAEEAVEVVFEKSANYFDSVDAPMAVHALLPAAKLIVLVKDPVERAYSWFQHMRTLHPSIYGNVTAERLFMTSDEVIAQLRRRCLLPGHYAQHLDRWLDHFPPSQLILIDAGRLRDQPASVLAELMKRLNLPATKEFDPYEKIRFVPTKGFHCAVNPGGRLKCLGKSKGRAYAPMSNKVRDYLRSYYKEHNEALREWLRKYNYPLPSFLTDTN